MTRETNRRILVVDDNTAIHDDFRKILCRRAGGELAAMEAALFAEAPAARAIAPAFTVDSANQGQEGWQLVVNARAVGQPYALAFIDMRMPPGWDGLETATHILADDPDVQLVICTAYSDHSWEDMFARLGATDRLLILKKPFDTVEVRQLAMALSEKWSLAVADRNRLRDLETMVEERTRQLAAHAARQQREIEAAVKVQRAMLPPPDIALPGATCAWIYRPSRDLGGDLLGIQPLDGRRTALWMIDVSGHGVASSLLAVQVSRALGDAVAAGLAPADLARRLNDLFPIESSAKMFFTLFYAVVNLDDGGVVYINCGHPHPMVQRADGVETLTASGVSIGWVPSRDLAFTEGQARLAPGDRLVIYSDGVNEARDREHQLFGTERLLSALASRRIASISESLAAVDEAVIAWMRDADAEPDDISMLALERNVDR